MSIAFSWIILIIVFDSHHCLLLKYQPIRGEQSKQIMRVKILLEAKQEQYFHFYTNLIGDSKLNHQLQR